MRGWTSCCTTCSAGPAPAPPVRAWPGRPGTATPTSWATSWETSWCPGDALTGPGPGAPRWDRALAAHQCGVPGLDHVVDEREPLVERKEGRLHRVHGEPLQVGPPVAERVHQGGHLRRHRAAAHQPVVRVDRDSEVQPPQQADRVAGDRLRRAGLHVRGRAHLQGDSLVPDVRGEPPQLDPAVVVHGDVVDNAYTMAEPVGATPLDRLPDRGQPERLAGVDGEVEVFPLQVLERVQMPGGWVARLRAGDVEADHAHVPVAHRQLG